MTDTELKQLIKHLSKVAGLDLSDERVERDLVAYKGHLAAIEKIRTVDLPIEAEPAQRFVLKRQA
jgi:hypothetical protein